MKTIRTSSLSLTVFFVTLFSVNCIQAQSILEIDKQLAELDAEHRQKEKDFANTTRKIKKVGFGAAVGVSGGVGAVLLHRKLPELRRNSFYRQYPIISKDYAHITNPIQEIPSLAKQAKKLTVLKNGLVFLSVAGLGYSASALFSKHEVKSNSRISNVGRGLWGKEKTTQEKDYFKFNDSLPQ